MSVWETICETGSVPLRETTTCLCLWRRFSPAEEKNALLSFNEPKSLNGCFYLTLYSEGLELHRDQPPLSPSHMYIQYQHFYLWWINTCSFKFCSFVNLFCLQQFLLSQRWLMSNPACCHPTWWTLRLWTELPLCHNVNHVFIIVHMMTKVSWRRPLLHALKLIKSEMLVCELYFESQKLSVVTWLCLLQQEFKFYQNFGSFYWKQHPDM